MHFLKSLLLTLSLIQAALAFSSQANARTFNRNEIFQGTTSYIQLSPSDHGSSLPSVGSSLFDKMFSKPGPNGDLVYDIPYPFDRFIDRLAGRRRPMPRYLTRIQAQKDVNSLIRFLGTDFFIRAPEEMQDQEVLFPFGRSLQKPRTGNAIANPWVSPREVATLLTAREPHLETLGRVQNRLFCGHVTDLKSMECISWNSEAGRFEFQVIEHYGEGHKQEVHYVNRSKCLACHQGGAPIFPKLDWLETDDNLTMELGLIFNNYGGDFREVVARHEDVMKAVNRRLTLAKAERQREFEPQSERFRVIKAGKYDRAVGDASTLIEANKLWIHLCGNNKSGNGCRRLAFKAYIVWGSKQPDEHTRFLNTRTLRKVDQRNFDTQRYINKNIALHWPIKHPYHEYEGFVAAAKAKIYSPFIFDRDPLTAALESNEVLKCLRGTCTMRFVQNLITPQAAAQMVVQGEVMNSFFNPRVLRETKLLPEDTTTLEAAILELAKSLGTFFYYGRTSFEKGEDFSSDIGSVYEAIDSRWERKLRPIGLDSVDAKLWWLLNKIDAMEDRFFDPLPFSRERMLFGLWEGLNDEMAKKFFTIATLKGPPKEMEKIAKPFAVDAAAEPTLALFSKACSECHASGGGKSSIPQFAYAADRTEFVSNIYYHRDAIIAQLKNDNMPPIYAVESLTQQQRNDMIDYVSNMSVNSIK